MSNWRGHIAGGAVAGTAYAAALATFTPRFVQQGVFGLSDPTGFFAALVILSILFGLWPDVDTNSKAQDIFVTIFFIFDIFVIWAGFYQLAAYLGLVGLLPILGHHRGWTHSRWAMVAVPLPFLLLPVLTGDGSTWSGLPYYGAAVIGFMSHLVLDKELIK